MVEETQQLLIVDGLHEIHLGQIPQSLIDSLLLNSLNFKKRRLVMLVRGVFCLHDFSY